MKLAARILLLALAAILAASSPSFAQPAEAVKSWTRPITGTATSAAVLFTTATNDAQTIYWSYSSVGSGNSATSEVSFDNGANWLSVPSYKINSPSAGTSSAWTADTTNVFQADIGASGLFRLRVSTYGSGTITTNANLRPLAGPMQTVVTIPGSGSSQQVVGNVASGAADSGNPVKVGGIYKATLPTYADGQRTELQANIKGDLNVGLGGTTTGDAIGATMGMFRDPTASGRLLGVLPTNYNGSTADVVRGMQNGTNSVGTGITAAGLVGQCDDTTPVAGTENSFVNGKMTCATHGLQIDGTCNQQAAIAVTAGSTTQIVALSGSTVVRVCMIALSIATTGTYTIVSGTGANCATPANATGVMNLIAGNADTIGDGTGVVYAGSAGGELCVTAVTGNVNGFVRYSQY